jgi:hypothetical protein
MSKMPINAAGDTAKTIAPVQTSPANDAEFCDSLGAYHRFGLKRSLLYELHTQGLIEGVSLRKRGKLRGKRLWSIDSIRAFLKSQMRRELR